MQYKNQKELEKPKAWIHENGKTKMALGIAIYMKEGKPHTYNDGEQVYINRDNITVLKFSEKNVSQYIFYSSSIEYVEIVSQKYKKEENLFRDD